jgi:orotidine-5'-phosphate decarboxylase
VAAVKPQVAFFEALGGPGLTALDRVCAHARDADLLVIADAKRGDIRSTAEAYAEAWLAPRDGGRPVADALTVNPYMGSDSVDLCRLARAPACSFWPGVQPRRRRPPQECCSTAGRCGSARPADPERAPG